MSVQLEVHITPGRFEPGDLVSGEVEVRRGGAARELRVSLVYRERSPDYTHAAVEIGAPVLHQGDLETGARFRWEVVLPADALPGQRLEHGETYWEVTAHCDRRGVDVHRSARLDDAMP